jgi:hypothetical protein
MCFISLTLYLLAHFFLNLKLTHKKKLRLAYPKKEQK